MKYDIPPLPPKGIEETKPILHKLISARANLAELKGVAKTIPNQSILIDTLTLQEALESSAIENIVTTHDELYKSQIVGDTFKNPATKEVNRYATALKQGFYLMKSNEILTANHIIDIHQGLTGNSPGFRTLPGTRIINPSTQEIIYTPPQDAKQIQDLMKNLLEYINLDTTPDYDPLIKMAIIHHQFESIHPFYDGNGRTGRIINLLYLVMKGLLDAPILYLSRYIIRNKSEYYRLLQAVRDDDAWEEWILYILEGVSQTSRDTIELIEKMSDLMMSYKHNIRDSLPNVYSQDLINNLFRYPYTKIEFLADDLNVHRKTASRYLNELANHGFLIKLKIGVQYYYVNKPLFSLFQTGIMPLPETDNYQTISS